MPLQPSGTSMSQFPCSKGPLPSQLLFGNKSQAQCSYMIHHLVLIGYKTPGVIYPLTPLKCQCYIIYGSLQVLGIPLQYNHPRCDITLLLYNTEYIPIHSQRIACIDVYWNTDCMYLATVCIFVTCISLHIDVYSSVLNGAWFVFGYLLRGCTPEISFEISKNIQDILDILRYRYLKSLISQEILDILRYLEIS